MGLMTNVFYLSLGGSLVRMVVGDAWPGGARAALEFPYQPRAELLQPGEAAELLVLSRDEEFITFKVGCSTYMI